MLHAFNQKNVRRVLAQRAPEEHVNEKNEDGITSMVFSPLAFMPLASVVAVLQATIGPRFASAVRGRQPIAYDVQLWPGGLQATAWNGEAVSRCEPDLMVRLTFMEGRPLVVLGEMKWDWLITADHLRDEIDRQRAAVGFQDPGADQLIFSLTKLRVSMTLPDVEPRIWAQVQRQASELAVSAAGTPEGRWGTLVSAFLEKAKQASFQGFRRQLLPDLNLRIPVFAAKTHLDAFDGFRFSGLAIHEIGSHVFLEHWK